jgi:hypothetical protein
MQGNAGKASFVELSSLSRNSRKNDLRSSAPLNGAESFSVVWRLASAPAALSKKPRTVLFLYSEGGRHPEKRYLAIIATKSRPAAFELVKQNARLQLLSY